MSTTPPASRPAFDLDHLFKPRSLAIVGASHSSGRGNYLIESLRFLSYSGPIYPVNPSRHEIWGLTCYPALVDLPEVPDHAVILVGRERVAGVIDTCGRLGIGAATVIASGYAEQGGGEGRRLQEELQEAAKRHRIALCGPNCQGVIDRSASCAAYAGPIDTPILPGKVAVISQSGGNASSLITAAYARHVGLTHVVSSGNEAGLDCCDYLEYLLGDGSVGTFCLFLETVRDPMRFLSLARRALAEGKPVVAVKIGRSEAAREAAFAHTGAFTGGAVLDDAFFAAAGVIRASSLDDAVDRCILFDQLARRRWPRGPGLGVTTIGGGAAGLAADLAGAEGLSLPPLHPELATDLAVRLQAPVTVQNPVDLPGATLTADAAATRSYLLGWAAEEGVDCLVVCVRLARESRLATLEAVAAAARQAPTPIFICSPTEQDFPPGAAHFADRPGIALVYGLDRCFAALSAAAEFARLRRAARLWESAEDFSLPDSLAQEVAAERDAGRRTASPRLTAGLLLAAGLPLARQALTTNPTEAANAAASIGYPVALKLADTDLAVHKTELGGVFLGLSNGAAVKAAGRLLQAQRPGAELIVQEMVPAGFELYLGSSNPGHGFPPLLLAGAGGVLLEAIGDVASALAPLGPAGSRALLKRLRAHRLLSGFRGGQARDLGAAARCVAGLSRLTLALGDAVAEIDVNPLLVLPSGKGAVVVDATVVYRRQAV